MVFICGLVHSVRSFAEAFSVNYVSGLFPCLVSRSLFRALHCSVIFRGRSGAVFSMCPFVFAVSFSVLFCGLSLRALIGEGLFCELILGISGALFRSGFFACSPTQGIFPVLRRWLFFRALSHGGCSLLYFTGFFFRCFFRSGFFSELILWFFPCTLLLSLSRALLRLGFFRGFSGGAFSICPFVRLFRGALTWRFSFRSFPVVFFACPSAGNYAAADS